jgi:hypothetical protein
MNWVSGYIDMQINTADTLEHEKVERAQLADDPRWQLLQRIVQSRTMRRATQLQRILAFVTESELLNPGHLIREQDVAQKVLGRKDDFDPAYDTIVRVQAGHLRHKLRDYFAGEGAEEPLRLTIPKGSYVPIFEPATTPAQADSADVSSIPEDAGVSAVPADTPANADLALNVRPRRKWFWVGLSLAFICFVVLFASWKSRRTPSANESFTSSKLSSFMARHGGKVAIVLPDTSLLLIQKILDLEIPLETYAQTSYPQSLSLQTKDPRLQKALYLLGIVRTTTLDEAQVGVDFIQMFNRDGLQGEIRYARDLHIRDLGEGNYILIGNQRSDPWVTLFTGRCNFRFVGNPPGKNYLFQNVHPSPGEPAQYVPIDSPQEITNYVDITLTPNLTDSGYVLLIIGSDVPANEAAARFLMGGDLPDFIKSRLQQQNLRTLEILLRGHHFHTQSNDKLTIVAYRVTMR